MEDQKILLQQLLRFENPEGLEKIMMDLRVYDPDRGWNLVNLTRENIISILERYLRSELNEQEVEDWANAVELREDIEFGFKDEEAAFDVIHVLANPVLEGDLTAEMARKMIEKLHTVPVVTASED